MPRSRVCAAVLVLALACRPLMAGAPSRAEALDAVHALEEAVAAPDVGTRPAAASDAASRASNTILRFAIESDEVVVDLGPAAVTWVDTSRGLSQVSLTGEQGLLLATYLAGEVKAQLAAGAPDPNPFAGWTAMLRVYRSLKLRQGVKISAIEPLLSSQAEGNLKALADQALARDQQALSRAYGGAGAKPAPGSRAP